MMVQARVSSGRVVRSVRSQRSPRRLNLQQPRDRPLDDPADTAEFGLVLDSAPRDSHRDPALVQVLPAPPVVIALVRVQLVGSASGPAGSTATATHRRVGLQQRLEHLAVVAVRRGQPRRAAAGALASHRMWYFDPGLPRSVRFGPVSSPSFSPAPTPRRYRPETSPAPGLRIDRRGRVGAAGPTPRRPATRGADATRCGPIRTPAPGAGRASGSRCRGRTRSLTARPGQRSAAAHPGRGPPAGAGSTARVAPRAGPRPTAAVSSSPRPTMINDHQPKIT